MSFSASIPPTAKGDEFDAALVGLQASPPLVSDDAKVLFEHATDVARLLASKLGAGGDETLGLNCNISGHAFQQEGDYKPESVTVSVAECVIPAPVAVSTAGVDTGTASA